jgi:phosphoglucosamine mutase
LIFRNFSTTGDGLVAALQILRIMKSRQARLSNLRQCWTRFPQLITNVKVREKIPFEELDGVLDLVGRAEKALELEGGRVLLRYSGTEPKARLLVEGAIAKLSNTGPSPFATLCGSKLARELFQGHWFRPFGTPRDGLS